jgi:cytochrome c553
MAGSSCFKRASTVRTGRRLLVLGRLATLLTGATLFTCAAAQGDAKRGEYLAKAGGCVACHTEEKKRYVSRAVER